MHSAMNSIHHACQRTFNRKICELKLKNMLVFGPENIHYLTGYSGNAAYLVATPHQYYLITDYRYFERALKECHGGCEVICRDRELESLGACINRFLPKGNTGFDAAYVTVAIWQEIEQELNHYLKPILGVVEQLRMRKTDWEIKSIKKAAAIADLALSETLTLVKAGVTEKELATELDYKMQSLGSDGVSFETILLFGARSALPHGKPGTTELAEGDHILIDFGAVVNGYRSDMTRSYVFKSGSDKQHHMFQSVIKAQQASLKRVKAGVNCIALNQCASDILADAGYAAYMGKGLGHGLGLQLHEPPFINTQTDYCLQSGNIITIEPGVYIPGEGGIRVEDDILVTDNGFEYLTHAPKPFILE